MEGDGCGCGCVRRTFFSVCNPFASLTLDYFCRSLLDFSFLSLFLSSPFSFPSISSPLDGVVELGMAEAWFWWVGVRWVGVERGFYSGFLLYAPTSALLSRELLVLFLCLNLFFVRLACELTLDSDKIRLFVIPQDFLLSVFLFSAVFFFVFCFGYVLLVS